MDGGAWWAAVHGVAKSQTGLSDFTFTFHFHALEKVSFHTNHKEGNAKEYSNYRQMLLLLLLLLSRFSRV